MYFDIGNLVWLQNAVKPSAIADGTITALQQMAESVNNIDETNFPNGFPQGLVTLQSLPFTEWLFPLVLSQAPITTTTSGSCGGFLTWSPDKFPGGSGWYFEAAIQISSATYTATAQLMNGTTVIGSVSTQATSWAVVRSAALTMPDALVSLTVNLESSDPSATASLWAARLIYVP